MAPCEYSTQDREKLINLMINTENTLESLNVSYFLCYMSLVGALKVNGPVSWLNSFDFCLLNEEISLIDEAFVFRTFKRNSLWVSYSSSDGVYEVKSMKEDEPKGKLVLFEKDQISGQMRRIGIRHRIIPYDRCELIHCFPEDLILKPLPQLKFLNKAFSAPREDIELIKYLFPDFWWKDMEPERCKKD